MDNFLLTYIAYNLQSEKNIPKSKSLTQLKINNMVASGFNSSLLELFVCCYQAIVIKKAPGSVRKVKRTFLNHA